MVEVTQQDSFAAQWYLEGPTLGHLALSQAFARHREQAIAEDRRGRTFSPTEIDKAIAEERVRVAAWLRKAEVQHLGIEFESASLAADAIGRGVHLDGEG